MAGNRKETELVSEDQMEHIARELLLLAEKNKSQIEIFFLNSITEKMKGGGSTRISGERIEDIGLSIRVLKRGRIGTAAISLPSGQEAINSTFKEALGNIEVRRAKKFELEQFSAYGVDRGEQDDVLFNRDILKMTEEDLIELTTRLTTVAYMVPKGQSITSEVSKTIEYIRVINSNGCDKSTRIGWLEGRINLSVERQEIPAVGFAEEYSRNKLDVHQIGAESLRTAEMHLQKHRIATKDVESVTRGGYATIIWSSKALADLLAFTLIPALRSRKLLRIDHPFLMEREQEMVPEFVHIYDDPLRRYGIGSTPFDDAGNTLERWNLVKDGALEHFISDLGRQSVFRKAYFERTSRSYRYPLNIFPTNLVLKLDDHYTTDNVIEHCPSGLYAKSIIGGHGSDMNTGNFSVGILEAYLVKNGALEGPIISGELIGNIFTLFKGIRLAGKLLYEHKPSNVPYGIVLPELATDCSTEEFKLQLH